MTIIYKPNDIMKKFGLKESLYKKYILALEKEGYVFQRNQQGHRIFSSKDLEIIETFLKLIKYDGMTIEKVAKKLGKQYHDNVITDNKSKQLKEDYNVMTLIDTVVKDAIEKHRSQMLKEFQEYLKQRDKQLERIESRANERDKLVLQSIRETQETKKLLLEIKEQVAITKEERKRKRRWWNKLFSNNE